MTSARAKRRFASRALLVAAVALAFRHDALGPLATAGAAIESDEATVGFGVTEVVLPVGVPLAGHSSIARRSVPYGWSKERPYAFFFRPSTGVHDPIQAKAMVLGQGRTRLVFLRLDLVAIDNALVSALRLRLADLGISQEHLIVSATHTHSGPGAWANSAAWAMIATDRYHPDIFNLIVSGAEEAVRQAVAAPVPGQLFATSFTVEGLQYNRRKRGAPVDNAANLLLVRAHDGKWLGGLVNFAIHPTALPPRNLALSADIPGAIERHLEMQLRTRNGGPDPVKVLFINGALGDVSPTARDFSGVERVGEIFAEAASRAMETLRKISPQWKAASAAADLGTARIPVRPCVAKGWLGNLFSDARLPIGELLAGRADLHLVQLGDMIMMSWPGEPTSALGFALKERAEQVGARQSWILGLTGDYKSYFTTPEEFAQNTYESCHSVFGPEGGQRILAAYRDLLDLLARNRGFEPSSPAPIQSDRP